MSDAIYVNERAGRVSLDVVRHRWIMNFDRDQSPEEEFAWSDLNLDPSIPPLIDLSALDPRTHAFRAEIEKLIGWMIPGGFHLRVPAGTVIP